MPSHAGGLEITGPVGVKGLPQLSFTDGEVGTITAAGHDAVSFVGVIGGIGPYSIVTV